MSRDFEEVSTLNSKGDKGRANGYTPKVFFEHLGRRLY